MKKDVFVYCHQCPEYRPWSPTSKMGTCVRDYEQRSGYKDGCIVDPDDFRAKAANPPIQEVKP